MKDGTLGFPIVPHRDGALAHNLEVGNFPYNFTYPFPFLRDYEELGSHREVVENLKIILWVLYYSSSRSSAMVPIPRDIIIPPMTFASMLTPLYRVFNSV